MNLYEKQILVLLSEAHEEDLVVLINSIVKGTGSPQLMQAVVDATSSLLVSGCCVMSSHRDPITLRLIPLSLRESVYHLARSVDSITWEDNQSLWVWSGKGDRPEVLLTKQGAKESHRILAEDGWIV